MEPNELITQLYVGYYNRAPDPEGLNYWMGRLAAGVSLADIAESFATSPEAISTYPWLAVEEPTEGQVGAFLEAIYQNMFNRSIDADGLEFYSNQLLTGERTAGEIIASIQANANTNTNNTDGQILANKVEVGLAWALAAEAQPGFEYNAEAAASANTILDGVNATQASVDAALGNVEEFFDAPASLEGALEALSAAREAVTAQQGEIADFLEGAFANEFVAAEAVDGPDSGLDVSAADVVEADIADAHLATATTLVTTADVNNSIGESATAFNDLSDAAQDARIATARADFNAEIAAAQDAADTAAEALEDGVAALIDTVNARATALESAMDSSDAADAELALSTAAFVGVNAGSNPDTNITDVPTVADEVQITNDYNIVVGVDAGTDTAGAAVFEAVALTEVDASGNIVVRSAAEILADLTTAVGGGGTIDASLDTVAEVQTYITNFTSQAGFADLLADLNAAADAQSAEDDAADALATALNAAYNAQDVDASGNAGVDYAFTAAQLDTNGVVSSSLDADGNNVVTIDYNGSADFGGTEIAELQTYGSALAVVASAQAELDTFNEAVTDWQSTESLVDQLAALNEELADLNQAATNAALQITNDETQDPAGLDVDLFEGTGAIGFNAGDDVYLFEEVTSDAAIISNFGVDGDDSIYFGAGYKLVALGDNDINDNVGNVGDLEIFWEETAGGDLVLYVENETFAGNGSTAGDITTITLDGVSADEVALVGGFLVEAEAAVA